MVEPHRFLQINYIKEVMFFAINERMANNPELGVKKRKVIQYPEVICNHYAYCDTVHAHNSN